MEPLDDSLQKNSPDLNHGVNVSMASMQQNGNRVPCWNLAFPISILHAWTLKSPMCSYGGWVRESAWSAGAGFEQQKVIRSASELARQGQACSVTAECCTSEQRYALWSCRHGVQFHIHESHGNVKMLSGNYTVLPATGRESCSSVEKQLQDFQYTFYKFSPASSVSPLLNCLTFS